MANSLVGKFVAELIKGNVSTSQPGSSSVALLPHPLPADIVRCCGTLITVFTAVIQHGPGLSKLREHSPVQIFKGKGTHTYCQDT